MDLAEIEMQESAWKHFTRKFPFREVSLLEAGLVPVINCPSFFFEKGDHYSFLQKVSEIPKLSHDRCNLEYRETRNAGFVSRRTIPKLCESNKTSKYDVKNLNKINTTCLGIDVEFIAF